ncbi:hypothetical protein M430DRAFT_269703 [Amorphotheca resinae ATCC 22711]|uniref:Uncharacterized protein n=1 Tax=Amorphotheca resinae ATCC 22711 TaxID=857342 RepID=A0A2T3BFW4_AMORE|nr:hypothetical protein M430DRAFT_269703 [Amorphotheca resinae ATCC 22711]PSS28306.1 hypothetical protein M430DRAFT_269703 [Amorphotheca resinae ATCC 22711]
MAHRQTGGYKEEPGVAVPGDHSSALRRATVNLFLRRALSRRVHAGSQVVQLHSARATALRCNPALVRAPGTGRGRGVFFAGGWFGRCGFDTFQKTASVDRLRGLDSTGGGRAGTFAQDSRLKGSSVGSSGLVSQWTGLCTWVAKGSSACCPIPRGAHYSAKGGAGSCTVPSPAYDPLRDRDPPNVIHRFFASLFCSLNFVLLFLARSCLQENYQPITALAAGARRSITRSGEASAQDGLDTCVSRGPVGSRARPSAGSGLVAVCQGLNAAKTGALDRGSSEAGQGSKGSYGSHGPRCLPPLAPSNLTHGPSAPRCCSQSHLFRLSPLPASLTGLPPTHRWGPSIPDAYHTLPYHPTTPGLPICILAFAWRVYFNGQPPLPHGPRPHPLPPQGPS